MDLIYIDPPFNSNRNYNILFEDLLDNEDENQKTTALKEAFKDTWSNINLSSELEELKSYSDNPQIYNFLERNREIFTNSQMSYLTMMAHRIYYMHKILKETGSFYLHCDPTMSHYLKILLDIIFGQKNFRNEIIWHYQTFYGKINSKRFYFKKHDLILCYSKSDNNYFNGLEYESNYQDTVDYKRWKKYYKNDNKIYENYYPINDSRFKAYRDKWIKDNNREPKPNDIIYTCKGDLVSDVWKIKAVDPKSKEKLYPTQKPEALLERIIKASSKEGDVVADFFCGCGTAVTVAEKLKRKWIGVDINYLAIGLIEDKRLKPLNAKYEVIGFPKDIASAEKLANDDKHKFEHWIVEYALKGHKTKATGDGGIEGHVIYSMGSKKVRACGKYSSNKST